MTKEQLYTALDEVHDRGKAIADLIRAAETELTGDDLTNRLIEIKDFEAQNTLAGEHTVKDNVVKLCDTISENG